MTNPANPRVLFALPGLHRVSRGAEAAFENIARELATSNGFDVTLAGSGPQREDDPYRFLSVASPPRERFEKWPKFPPFRNEYRWEEFFFTRRFKRRYRPDDFDLTVTCSFPFLHWFLRRKQKNGTPPHVFVTENSDWAPQRRNSEYRFFGCDGLVCTNPEYRERHRDTWPGALIPNGIDEQKFRPGSGDPARFVGGDPSKPVVLMVSALIPSKFVADGIEAVAALGGARLVVAGDGPLREECDTLGRERLGEGYRRLTLTGPEMPDLYRSADCLLHLSRAEAFGNIYIEAAACGLPVVAHDNELTRWILGADGFFADGASGDSIVAALRGALEAPATEEVREERRARVAARFAWPVVGRQYAAFFREILAGKGGVL